MYDPSAFINDPPAVTSVLNFLSEPTVICAIDTKFPLGAFTITLTGVPEYSSLTSPVTKIVSPSAYDDLSVVTTIEPCICPNAGAIPILTIKIADRASTDR